MDSEQILAIIAEQKLPPGYRTTVDDHWRPIAQAIATAQRAAGRSIVVGVNGPQGSGKSTFCLFVEAILRNRHGLGAAILSLDDLYLGRAERQRLAGAVHPLLAVRGVPGTHDVALGQRTIDALTRGQGPLPLPRFDKATDDRVPEFESPIVTAPVDVVLFEGWCVAAEPEEEISLSKPINALEAEADRDGSWRTYVNECLGHSYRPLFASIDLLIMLQPPGFEVVSGWRQLQERKLRQRTGRGMTDAEILRFVMHYERLTRHMLGSMPGRADIVVAIDAAHRVTRVSQSPKPGAG